MLGQLSVDQRQARPLAAVDSRRVEEFLKEVFVEARRPFPPGRIARVILEGLDNLAVDLTSDGDDLTLRQTRSAAAQCRPVALHPGRCHPVRNFTSAGSAVRSEN